ncbi:ribonuclease HII [Helicobacter saguini]|uniref:Ribonuclease n=1 Tax=Helicobacter saguini TaxID=1548018 RepID=A0A347VSZ4_9HELI|nr:ribonuclease HII [Helicobacter saguini]MWV62302.1 ribonuclease HII [Helicobacter saguini]MWV67025.1 ribonuclease HII [Helicobacter saguini]MWV69374.1 ribonuclease HII [Helicobacter saguini]MWV71071.1 ribonuclease HII [Helicobacter saguini]TLD95028.1 ribonuclease HII [Helicobacter saguini]
MYCGIDEAGRGCIAGSLFISGVVLDSKFLCSFKNLGIKDSKKLSYENRNVLSTKIIDFLESNNGFYLTLSFNSNEIDSKGLSTCLKNALIALREFAQTHNSQKIIFDGNTNFGVGGIDTLIKGDSKNVLIAAASILAKCQKDTEMIEFDKIYPQYDFKKNKGYLTKSHIDSIKQYGLCEIHRKSYHIKSLESL